MQHPDCQENCRAPDFPTPSSPANDWRNLNRLYVWVAVQWFGCLGCLGRNAGLILMLLRPIKMLKSSQLSLVRRHIKDISWTYMGHIYNVSRIFFGHTWNLSERYLNHILRLNFKKKLNVLAITGFFHGLTAFVLNMNGFVLHGWFHVKQGEKRSTSKSNIFMKKHERI